MTPEEIRALRGGRSRAAFAALIGVTQQTVYRWELAPSAAEARTPRGEALARLGQVRARERGRDHEATAPIEPAGAEGAARGEIVPLPPAGSRSRDLRDDTGSVLVSLQRALSGEIRRGQSELLAVAARAEASREARALAQAGIAVIEGLLRSDGQRALASIAGLLADIDRFGDPVRPWLHAAAAVTFAQADGRLFDVGRVQTHGARISLETHPEAWIVAWLAGLSVAFGSSDFDLVRQVLARLGPEIPPGLPPLLDLHIEETRALAALVNGHHAVAAERFRAVATKASELGHAAIEARSLACLAMRQLDDLAAPELVLAGARRARRIAQEARLGVGIHTFLALRAEGEALLRLGSIAEVDAVLAAIAAAQQESAIVVTAALPLVTRHAMLQGKSADLFALADALDASTVPSLGPLARGQAAYARALGHLTSARDPEAGVEAWEIAEGLLEGWTFLWREALLHGTTMRVVAGKHDDAGRSLRRLARALDAAPSPWLGAHHRRAEGVLRAATGEWATARELLGAAAATFDLAEDRVDAALCRLIASSFAAHYAAGDPAAEADRAHAAKVASDLGVVEPAGLRVGLARLAAASFPTIADQGEGDLLARIASSVRRLAVRGTTAPLLQRELVLVARQLFSGHAVRLEEIDSHGNAALLAGDGETGSGAQEELGDGSGRRLRLVIVGLVDERGRTALRLLADAAGLSLEITTLRGLGASSGETSRAEGDDVIPGFIGVSPSIRRLRTEIARLGASRATVIVTGESGSGKELVARAIHDLSSRKGRAYVPFNCATVPRDLFEGQLFGFKRGSFTGASADHPGVVRAADGGTLFLDEIGELPLDVQPKLLRFLENGEVFPLGAKHAVRVDVRIIAATHRDLAALVRAGAFREDLFYRLQVVPLRVPPLRERPEDIAPLARHFVRLLAPEGQVPVLSPDALAALARHTFPGNVRELRNVIERALAFAPLPEVLHPEHLRVEGNRGEAIS